jgi:hypothetical protein
MVMITGARLVFPEHLHHLVGDLQPHPGLRRLDNGAELPRLVIRGCKRTFSLVLQAFRDSADFRQAPYEIARLDVTCAHGDGAFVGRGGFGSMARPAQQVGAGGVKGVEAVEFHGDLVDHTQADLRSLGHRYCNSAIQPDNWRVVDALQRAVQIRDFGSIGRIR